MPEFKSDDDLASAIQEYENEGRNGICVLGNENPSDKKDILTRVLSSASLRRTYLGDLVSLKMVLTSYAPHQALIADKLQEDEVWLDKILCDAFNVTHLAKALPQLKGAIIEKLATPDKLKQVLSGSESNGVSGLALILRDLPEIQINVLKMLEQDPSFVKNTIGDVSQRMAERHINDNIVPHSVTTWKSMQDTVRAYGAKEDTLPLEKGQ